MNDQKPPGKPFTGLSGQMRSSVWLAAEDIAGSGDVKVTIEAVYQYDSVEFEAGRKKENVFTLKFTGKSKELCLNSTNRRALYRAFGASTKDWLGQTVTLYVDANVKVKGVKVGGIRMREASTRLEMPA